MDVFKSTIFYGNVQATIQAWFESILNVQEKRKDEVIRSANKARLAGATQVPPGTRIYDEKGKSSPNYVNFMLITQLL